MNLNSEKCDSFPVLRNGENPLFFRRRRAAAGSFAHYKFKWETMKKLKQDEEEEVIITNGVKECFMLKRALQWLQYDLSTISFWLGHSLSCYVYRLRKCFWASQLQMSHQIMNKLSEKIASSSVPANYKSATIRQCMDQRWVQEEMSRVIRGF